MFDLIFSGIRAYQQVGMFLGALMCLGLAGLILGDSIYWRMHARRVSGTILGVIRAGGMYTPVYRYAMPDGVTHEAKSDISSGSPSAYKTGSAVPLLVSPDNPSDAHAANNYVFDLVGLVLLVPGLWLGETALTAYPVTPMTWIMAALMLLYFAERAHGLFNRNGPRLSLRAWKQQHDPASTPINLADVKPAEQFQPAADTSQSFGAQLKKNKLALPIVALFAIIAASIGWYQGMSVAQLEANGVRTRGEVVDLKEEYSSDSHGGSYVYYPIVNFRTGDDRLITFKDSMGSNPPTHRPGDQVRVLFAPDNPGRAMIDRGIWNWTIPAVMVIVGVLLGWLFVYMWKQKRLAATA